MGRSRARLVVVVKAYPQPSRKYSESVCVAGIRTDTRTPQWCRLYPVVFRDMPPDKQFEKWTEIELDVSPSSDSRPESLKADVSSIEKVRRLSSRSNWADRLDLVRPLVVGSMCDVLVRQKASGISLAAFRPHQVLNVVLKPEAPEWDARDWNVLSQLNLLAQDKPILEKIPWRWLYQYSCGDSCGGHTQTIIDWEIGAAWRKWRRKLGSRGAAEAVRERWLSTLCGSDRDPIFLVGNQIRRPSGFMVLGVVWPKRSPDVPHRQLRLDLASHSGDDLSVAPGLGMLDA